MIVLQAACVLSELGRILYLAGPASRALSSTRALMRPRLHPRLRARLRRRAVQCGCAVPSLLRAVFLHVDRVHAMVPVYAAAFHVHTGAAVLGGARCCVAARVDILLVDSHRDSHSQASRSAIAARRGRRATRSSTCLLAEATPVFRGLRRLFCFVFVFLFALAVTGPYFFFVAQARRGAFLLLSPASRFVFVFARSSYATICDIFVSSYVSGADCFLPETKASLRSFS